MKAQLLLIFTLLVVNSGTAFSQTPVPNPQTTATPTITVTPKSSQLITSSKRSLTIKKHSSELQIQLLSCGYGLLVRSHNCSLVEKILYKRRN
ncbi:hypothetical protein [Fischerella sp. PCC 9605]|uniref:hypothetical protein n=1 Tax=Fischerella sp. PCC 9605 TaxID=1173024 RepID=UPI0012DD46BB|nr:hypothetical protein [Fischerella sp. PCC 9605]